HQLTELPPVFPRELSATRGPRQQLVDQQRHISLRCDELDTQGLDLVGDALVESQDVVLPALQVFTPLLDLRHELPETPSHLVLARRVLPERREQRPILGLGRRTEWEGPLRHSCFPLL